MKKKEVINFLLSKVEEDKKDALIKELRDANTKTECKEILGKYGITLTEEELEPFKQQELSDDDLDIASGGGCCKSNCNIGCG